VQIAADRSVTRNPRATARTGLEPGCQGPQPG